MIEDMSNKYDLAVVVDPYGGNSETITPIIGRVLKTTKNAGVNTHIIAITHTAWDPKGYKKTVRLLEEMYPKQATSIVIDKYSYAYAYLKGLESGVNIADIVIELDSGGGHQPEQITRFLNGLEEYDIVFSSRFRKGAENKYPWQRRLVSWGGTLMSHLFLDTHLSDTTSGFEAFKGDVIKDLLKAIPPENWLSVRGPYHMFQTEIRAYLEWQNKYSFTEVPISYGIEKTGKPLPARYLLEALHCFYKLWRQKSELKAKINEVFESGTDKP